MQLKDINLDTQTFVIKIIKGGVHKEVIKPIKDVALKYWESYLAGSNDGNLYLLGEGLYPDVKPIRPEQITKRWKVHVKDKLGIKADFYALKHLNTDQMSDKLGLKSAAILNSHTQLSTTKIYAVGENSRQMERIKKIDNEL